MRNFVFIALILSVLFACNSPKGTVEKKQDSIADTKVDTIRIENEELEYKIIIYEIGFTSWLATQRPREYYSQSTLEVKNNFYVMEWNNRVLSPLRYDPDLYVWPIQYDPKIDYGMEVNYLLYMYFEFFQQKYGQRLN